MSAEVTETVQNAAKTTDATARLVAVAAAIFVAGGVALAFVQDLFGLPERVKTLETQVTSLTERIESLEGQLATDGPVSLRFSEIDDTLSDLQQTGVTFGEPITLQIMRGRDVWQAEVDFASSGSSALNTDRVAGPDWFYFPYFRPADTVQRTFQFSLGRP